MLTPHKNLIRIPAETAARVFIALGLTPNKITVLALFLGCMTSLWYLWSKNSVGFGILMMILGLFDLMDGTVARLTHTVSKFGSYLDAICDRVFEAVTLLAVACVSGYWGLSGVLLFGMMLISYAKARAAIEVTVENNAWPDFMERTERDLIFILGVILWGLFPKVQILGIDVLRVTMIFLIIAVYFTCFQRILRARKMIESRT